MYGANDFFIFEKQKQSGLGNSVFTKLLDSFSSLPRKIQMPKCSKDRWVSSNNMVGNKMNQRYLYFFPNIQSITYNASILIIYFMFLAVFQKVYFIMTKTNLGLMFHFPRCTSSSLGLVSSKFYHQISCPR